MTAPRRAPGMASGGPAHAAAERVARESYGRLVAVLAASTGDVALAEDALASAFETALAGWPDTGVPASPEGWLLTVARNRQRDVWRSAARRTSVPIEETDAVSPDPLADLDPLRIPDRRLELLFVCAHPAIDPAARTPLMLQLVLGFDAQQIATAFAVPPAAMAQRLVRAKRRIRDAGIPFAVPDRRAMPERLPAVLEAIYACASITWRADAGELAAEAGFLAMLLADLLGDEAEAWALAALISFSLSRRGTATDDFVPLDEQDPRDWDAELIADGDAALRRASACGGALGRFRIEAAIQAVHAARRRTGRTDDAALRTLHLALVQTAPSLGARVALAAVLGRTDGPDAGLAALPADAEGFQPWWATRARLLAAAGRLAEARAAFERAAALAEDAAVQAYLREQAASLPR